MESTTMILLVYVISLSISILFAFLFGLHHHIFGNKNKSSAAAAAGPLPPGNTGWPLVGESLHFLWAGWKGHPEKFVLDRVAKYSSSVFRTHLVGEKAAVLSGASGNKFLFSNENKLVRAWFPSGIDKIFPSSTRSSSEEEGIKLRRMLHTFLKTEALRRYIGKMDRMAQKHFEEGWENKSEVVVLPLAKDYTFQLACRLFASVEDPQQVDRLSKPFNLLASSLFAIPIDLPGTPFNKGIKASKIVRQELLSIIKQRKIDLAERKASPTQDILSHMLLTSDENGKFMQEFDIADKILGLLIGGRDSASVACTFIVKYLAELPHIYDGVYNEQMEILKSKAPGDSLNWEDLQKMKYSWNVACEVMRLATPVPGTFREAIADFSYKGYSIPKGFKLYWSATATHKNPEFFPEPEKFDPSRFQGAGPAPYTFVPFGGGPRMCPGLEYARFEILVFMHHLVKRFKFEKMIPNDGKFVVDPMPIPAKGLPIRLIPHEN
ncbi:hypothetical protein ABFS82_08G109600 [Erythranthe guttata]